MIGSQVVSGSLGMLSNVHEKGKFHVTISSGTKKLPHKRI